jgi:uncharacterized membrane protein YcaP (DUF421 family)
VTQTLLDRFGTTGTDALVVVLSGIAIYVAVIAATRLVGLRSFSKMSAFDFAMTVAIGSIIATVITANASIVNGLLAVVTIYGLQYVVAWLRRQTNAIGFVDNRPLLLMRDGVVLEDHLDLARISREDLRGRLRAASVRRVSEVRAVVLETTGDVSVLVGDHLDEELLHGVVGAEGSWP